jgi:hypothetical protein
MEEQLVKDEPRRKMKVNIPDPVRRISKEEGEGKMLSWRYD